MSAMENFVKDLSGKPVLVFGLGRTGLSVVRELKKAGAEVIVGDDNDKNLQAAKDMGAQLLDVEEQNFARFSFLVLSPGVPFTHPEPHHIVKKAQEASLEIICDIELYHIPHE